MKIYFDTNIWNRSLIEGVKPAEMMPKLIRFGVVPVLGIHALYELQKTFHSHAPGSLDRGTRLLAHLEEYFASGLVYVTKETTELLTAEMYRLKESGGTSYFLEADDIAKILIAVRCLASGQIDEKWRKHTAEKSLEKNSTRAGLAEDARTDPLLRDRLRVVTEAELQTWLAGECRSDNATRRLAVMISRQFPGTPHREALEWARALLREPQSKFALSLMRADAYTRWRCANRDSIPNDLLDDTYHVLNASYCDIYLTAEPKQAEYASLLLPPSTKVWILRESDGVESWLLDLCR